MPRGDTAMNVFETILARRSVRNYSRHEVKAEAIRTLLEAAVRAPTALHEEPWSFAVVQDREFLRHLSDMAKPLFIDEVRRQGTQGAEAGFGLFARADFNIFYDAGTLIVICAKPLGPFAAADCWLAAENLMLAACALGLGSCVIGSAVPALNSPAVKQELHIPADYAAVAPIIVGYRAGTTLRSPRREPVVLTWKH